MVIYVRVEIPTGSRNKYEYDERLGEMILDRCLTTAMSYPADYGFVPDTMWDDGDPLDALVIVSQPTFPGCLVPCRPVGILRMKDEKGLDDKLLCVPIKDTVGDGIEGLDDVPQSMRLSIEHFFQVYKMLDGVEVELNGWGDETEARAAVERGYELADAMGDTDKAATIRINHPADRRADA